MAYETLRRKLESGKLVVMDAATGTELEKRGAVMSEGAWCGVASVDFREVLEDVHRSYIEVGAELISTNTFASSRIMLAQAGEAGRFEEINRNAVEAALKAREQCGTPEVVVAGCLSHMIPVQTGTDEAVTTGPSAAEMQEAFEELALLLKDAGCEMLMLEMMYHPHRVPWVLQAAQKTGLPLWVGFSIRQNDSGELVSFAHDQEFSLEELFACVAPEQAEVMGVMHTAAPLVSPGLARLRKHFSGPLSAYPDSGFFKMPHWQFDAIPTPEELQEQAREWKAEGVQVLGGCCGLGPEHIAALRELRDE